MSSQSFVAGPATHHQYHPHALPYQHDSPPHANPRRRRRDHDELYHPYAAPHAQSYAAASSRAVPCHVPRDPLALSHLQERLFPPPPAAHPGAGPPPPKRSRRDPRWDPPPPTVPILAAPERIRDEGDPGPLLSRDEIERRSPSRRDGIDSALEARLRASYCAYLRCLGIRLGLPQTTIATAMVYCHRFFFHRSHACHDRFLIATAALFLAAKSEETACLLNTVLRASCEVDVFSVSPNYNFWNHKELAVANGFCFCVLQQDWFQQYRESVIQAEQMILTTLDFELEVAHPYASLSSALNKLGLLHTVLFHVAWNLINEG
ncbi:hypothetical protein PR202_ga31348 [Eleusine coracana subsp. coracana]|uniref:Cyclin-like domain-containing protein n=1 Tax=Eleusine coracana subsp. coracana TaxID=191504 RepID=A0AAV5DSX6_ELECO|nr:hypothetical protein PR202_ga31348 [Eleusine coracana subsp. coracana]